MRHKHGHSGLSVMEAVETLSIIVDLDLEEPTGTFNISDYDEKTVKRVQWLSGENVDKNLRHIKVIFGVLLNYLRNFYKKEYSYAPDPQALDGIKKIMTLVGDAARKMDSHGAFFRMGNISIAQLREYKLLNEFYRTQIAHQIDNKDLGKWLLALSQRNFSRQKELEAQAELEPHRVKSMEETAKHLFVDLEAVRKDSEYELFFIRKEDGSYFFSPRLLRNIKLICDFADVGQRRDPIASIRIWEDLQMHNAAIAILNSIQEQMDLFYQDAYRHQHKDLVAGIHKCLMALMLCASENNLKQEDSQAKNKKDCRGYFRDFLNFLRELLHSVEYQKLVANPNKSYEINTLLLEMIHGICNSLYLSLDRFHDLGSILPHLIVTAYSPQEPPKFRDENYLWKVLEKDYSSLSAQFKLHSRGPLTKILDSLEEDRCKCFEPFSQYNLPSQLYMLTFGGQKVLALHLPSQTTQEYVHRVAVLEEFKGFLRSCLQEHPPHRHLLINMQDRTSWREHARAVALEELRVHENFDKALTVITLAKDTDFYHQLGPYSNQNHAVTFIEQLKTHFGDEVSGYYFPSAIQSSIQSHLGGMIDAIHRVFFSNKNILLQEHRLNFIEIFDLFLLLKVIDFVKPNSFSFTCKDGIDIAVPCHALLFIFLKMIDDKPIEESIHAELNRILYAPALMIRERLILKERFERMIGALKVIELAREEYGPELFAEMTRESFGPYLQNGILDQQFLTERAI